MKRLTAHQYADALVAAWSDTPTKERPVLIKNFVALLRRQRATKVLPRILEWVQRLEDQENGVTRVTVTSAGEMDDKKLATALSKHLGQVAIDQIVDPKLIGGIAIRFGDQQVDGSVSTRLKQFSHQLRSA